MVRPRDIITFGDLLAGAFETISDLNERQPEAERIIAGVTATVERYIGRPVMATEHTQALTVGDWRPNKYEPYGQAGSVSYTGPGAAYTLRETERAATTRIAQADVWPVIEGVTSGLTAGPKPHLLQVDNENADAGEYTYWGGWSRDDQTADDFSGLTTDPDPVPHDIRQVAIALTLYELVRATDGTMGRRRIQTSGPVSVTVDGSDTGFPMRELARLDHYKRLVS